MKFCETCGNVLVVKNDDGKNLYCRRCKKNLPLTEEIVIGASYSREKKEIEIIDENSERELPTTNVLCPICDKMIEAFWWMQQTRGADEPPTRFYECKQCKHRWRDYS